MCISQAFVFKHPKKNTKQLLLPRRPNVNQLSFARAEVKIQILHLLCQSCQLSTKTGGLLFFLFLLLRVSACSVHWNPCLSVREKCGSGLRREERVSVWAGGLQRRWFHGPGIYWFPRLCVSVLRLPLRHEWWSSSWSCEELLLDSKPVCDKAYRILTIFTHSRTTFYDNLEWSITEQVNKAAHQMDCKFCSLYFFFFFDKAVFAFKA